MATRKKSVPATKSRKRTTVKPVVDVQEQFAAKTRARLEVLLSETEGLIRLKLDELRGTQLQSNQGAINCLAGEPHISAGKGIVNTDAALPVISEASAIVGGIEDLLCLILQETKASFDAAMRVNNVELDVKILEDSFNDLKADNKAASYTLLQRLRAIRGTLSNLLTFSKSNSQFLKDNL